MDPEERTRPVEIKDLNKTQLILLALLLSFITSIATGIVTVTLMQQAPSGVSQTINRVVEETIEKAVPNYSPTTTQTVVVKEDDLVVGAVAATRANIAMLFSGTSAANAGLPSTATPIADAYSAGNGIYIVSSATIDPTKSYSIQAGSTLFDAKVTATSPLGFSLLTITTPNADTKDLPAAVFGKDADIKVGQTAVIITSTAVSKGIVQSVTPDTNASAPAGTNADIIALDPAPDTSLIGAYIADLDGNVIGLVVPEGSNSAQAIGIDSVESFIANPVTSPGLNSSNQVTGQASAIPAPAN